MKILIALIASICALDVANAQIAGGLPRGPENTNAAASKKPGEQAAEERRVENHIERLRHDLRITAAEEPQWNTVAETMRENAKDIDWAIDKRDAALRTNTAVENLNAYADVVQAHAVAVKRLADTFAPLYSEMSNSQKKIADVIFSHRHRHRGTDKT